MPTHYRNLTGDRDEDGTLRIEHFLTTPKHAETKKVGNMWVNFYAGDHPQTGKQMSGLSTFKTKALAKNNIKLRIAQAENQGEDIEKLTNIPVGPNDLVVKKEPPKKMKNLEAIGMLLGGRGSKVIDVLELDKKTREQLKKKKDTTKPNKKTKPGWKLAKGGGFWSVDSKDPYWQTDAGYKEALKVWGKKPGWIKRR